MARLILLDDHLSLHAAIRDYLQRTAGHTFVAELTRGSELVSSVARHRPDLLILDLELEGEHDFDPAGAMGELRAVHPDLKVVVFSGHDEGIWLARLIDDLAVNGYVHKSEPLAELVHAVEHALRGATYYSPHVARRKRELDRAQWDSDDLETLQLLADGYTVSQIAERLHVSDRTVRRCVERIRSRIRATSNAEAVVKARRQGLVV
ncbi:MAG: response regulator transcription factor [Anaerolineae bacterium]|nr:response regulator transcription factor [Anaerolineae bacterium]